MCGIVVHYGDAGNRLTRVLTGMWAIIYRAPDSTGIGLIRSDLETLKMSSSSISGRALEKTAVYLNRFRTPEPSSSASHISLKIRAMTGFFG